MRTAQGYALVDIHRLQDVREGKKDRRAGRTFAMLLDALEESDTPQVNPPPIFIVGATFLTAKYLCSHFMRIAQQLGYNPQATQANRTLVGTQEYRFVSMDSYQFGWSEKSKTYCDHWCYEKGHEECLINKEIHDAIAGAFNHHLTSS